jgi:hypothetical protein
MRLDSLRFFGFGMDVDFFLTSNVSNLISYNSGSENYPDHGIFCTGIKPYLYR